MSKKSEYVRRMQTQLEEWDADVYLLAAQGKSAGAEANAVFADNIKRLGECRNTAHKALRQIRAASESASGSMHAALEAAFKVMRENLVKAQADVRASART